MKFQTYFSWKRNLIRKIFNVLFKTLDYYSSPTNSQIILSLFISHKFCTYAYDVLTNRVFNNTTVNYLQ